MHAETAFSPREVRLGRRAIGAYVVLAALAIVAARVLPMTGWFDSQPAPAPVSTNVADAQPLTDLS